MKHHLLAAFVLTLGASGSVSCTSSDEGGRSGPPDRPFSCEQLTTCAACTPVLGCGWCQSGDKGLCTTDPHRCARAETFTWTWEAAFCPAASDAGAGDAVDASPWPDATSPADRGPADLDTAR